jgi:hypothetical protein
MSSELTFSGPVELTDAEIDAVAGGDCVFKDPALTTLKTQFEFLGMEQPFPNFPGGLSTANNQTGKCFTLPS